MGATTPDLVAAYTLKRNSHGLPVDDACVSPFRRAAMSERPSTSLAPRTASDRCRSREGVLLLVIFRWGSASSSPIRYLHSSASSSARSDSPSFRRLRSTADPSRSPRRSGVPNANVVAAFFLDQRHRSELGTVQAFVASCPSRTMSPDCHRRPAGDVADEAHSRRARRPGTVTCHDRTVDASGTDNTPSRPMAACRPAGLAADLIRRIRAASMQLRLRHDGISPEGYHVSAD